MRLALLQNQPINNLKIDESHHTMKSYIELAKNTRHYLNKNILSTLNEASLDNFQISEKVDLPFFILYYDNGLRFSFSLQVPSPDSLTGTYEDDRLITEDRIIINDDLAKAINLIESNVDDSVLSILEKYTRQTLQIFYIPNSTNKPFSIDYTPLKGCNFSFIISENYRQSKSFTVEFINAFNAACEKNGSISSKIHFNPYHYVKLKEALYANSNLVTLNDTEVLSGQKLDDEIYKAVKKTIESIEFPMQKVCPDQALQAVYLTLDRGKDYKSKGYNKRFTYSFFPIDESVQDKVTASAVEDNVSRLPYELLLSNFGTYVINNKYSLDECTSRGSSYIEKIIYIVEDYCSKTDFTFLTSLGLDFMDLRPPKLRYYISPINIDYIESKFNLSKAFIVQLKKSEMFSSIFCTLINFLSTGLNNAAWTIYLDQDIKQSLKGVFNRLRKE